MNATEFQIFIEKSGIKKNWIASKVLGVPHWVISNWLKGATMLYPYQQEKLDKFCSDFYKNNPHMQESK